MSRSHSLSGFPEWSPHDRVIERTVLQTLSEVFELHGFVEIETRAVEPVERLSGDSDASKEIYGVTRLRADADTEAKLGLHFDLTVPFARYVEERQGELTFPFKRYQSQKVWRGERPQDGRFREFYQADIDIVGVDELPAHMDAEVATVMARALARLPIPAVTMHVNHRALVDGFYRAVGITDVAGALRSVDKLDKIGPEGVRAEMAAAGHPDVGTDAVIELAAISGGIEGVIAAVDDLWETSVRDDRAAERAKVVHGLEQLRAIMAQVESAVPGIATVDLRIARGLDYYTGMVVETTVAGHEDIGSVCSGGRYDSLVGGGGFPRVGMSVGVSRLVSLMISHDMVSVTRAVPTAVMVAVVDDESRAASVAVADALRARGICADVAPRAAKFGKQIQMADRRSIPFVWFPDGDSHSVKDIRTGEQLPADPHAWEPPENDRRPRIVPALD